MNKKSIIIFILSLNLSCKENSSEGFNRPDDLLYKKLKVDSLIKNNEKFKILNKQFESGSYPYKEKDSPNIKTTNVINISKFSDVDKPLNFKHFQASAYLDKNNQLLIYVRSNSGFSSSGIQIIKKINDFSIRPFSNNDIGGSEKDFIYKVNYQNLTLDKVNYKNGDSIFGKLNAEIITFIPEVIDNYKGKIHHDKKRFLTQKYYGHFQTVVKNQISE